MAEKVLIVDDDKDLAGIIKQYLENHGFQTQVASNGTIALGITAKDRPDIILADVDMPRMDGLTLCKKIKDSEILSSIPMIIMSGKKISETDMLSGYTLGADDYISKPFSYPVLLAKIKALLRITGIYADKNPILEYKGILINTKNRTAKIGESPLKLTAKEFDLLAALIANRGSILSAPNLLESIWGYNTEDYSNYHTVEVHISNLRKKLGSMAKSIVAVQGHGYTIE
ncbi:MAG: response regulator transcription factor [Elusimicrobiales bacterium]|nr:response regulator transcription factor [Elusimicrobiales bacterium]